MDIHTIALTRNLIGVLSAGLVLLFMVDSAGARRLRLSVTVGLTATMGALLILDLLQIGHPREVTASVQGPADPASAYWLILVAAHLVGDAVALVVCWSYSLRTEDRDLVWSLRLFAVGSVFAFVFWCGDLWHLYDGVPALLPYLSLVIGVHGFIRAASLLVPTATALMRSWTALRGHLASVATVARSCRGGAARGARQATADQAPGGAATAFPAGTAGAQADHRDVRRAPGPAAVRPAGRLRGSAPGRPGGRGARRPPRRCRTRWCAGPGPARQTGRRAAVRPPPPARRVFTGSPATLLGIARMWPSMTDALPCHDRPAPAERLTPRE
ncbi:hypothetical protein SGLAM104S_06465 [Streptomyces glaucescens]